MHNKISICVDKRIELISSVQTLVSYWDNLSLKFYNKRLFSCPYKSSIHNYFNNYKYVITDKYNSLADNVLNFSAFFNLLLYFTDPPGLLNEIKIPEDVLDLFPKKNILFNFVTSLKEYSKLSKYDKFFASNELFFKELINTFTNTINLDNAIGLLENYVREYKNTYNIIIDPLCLGNYSFRIDNNIFILLSPIDYKDGKYLFSTPIYNKMLIWHEVSHSFVNHLTDKFKVILANLKMPIYFHNTVYDDISTVINESIINAICIRLLDLDGDIASSKHFLNEYNNRGYVYLNDIIQWLITYENEKISFSEYYLKHFSILVERIKNN